MPRPAERADIVKKSQDDSGHFGIERIVSVVATEYSWNGMDEQLRRYVRSCNTRARVRAPFVQRGMFYRWSVCLAGSFP